MTRPDAATVRRVASDSTSPAHRLARAVLYVEEYGREGAEAMVVRGSEGLFPAVRRGHHPE